MRSSSIFNKLRSSSIFKKIEVVFHLQNYWGRLSFSKKLRLSSIFINIEVIFYLQKKWGCLPFSKVLRLSSVFKNIDVLNESRVSHLKILVTWGTTTLKVKAKLNQSVHKLSCTECFSYWEPHTYLLLAREPHTSSHLWDDQTFFQPFSHLVCIYTVWLDNY